MNSIKKIAQMIAEHFTSHGAQVKVTLCEIIGNGERYIFDILLKKGAKERLIFSAAKDIQTALQVPLFQPFYDNLSIRLAFSQYPVMENSFLKMLESQMFRKNNMRICLPLGYDMRGAMRFYDLASDSAPQTLVSGGSGGGKSVLLRCFILAIVIKYPTKRVNIIVIDCGGNSLDLFHSLPHLSHPIVKDVKTAFKVLKALAKELHRRLALPLEQLRLAPSIFIAWDEYNSTIKNIMNKEERDALTAIVEDLLRRARKTKIHFIIATQECNKEDMMINLNNFNARIAFRCSDFYNSRAILGISGAEHLPGKGALLYKSPEQLKPLFIQGAFISTEDLKQQVNRITSASHDLSNKFIVPEASFQQSPISTPVDTSFQTSVPDIESELPKVSDVSGELIAVILWVLSHKTTSKNRIKEKFKMGNRVDGIMDELLRLNLVSGKFSNQPRTVVPQIIEDISTEAMTILTANGASTENI